MTQINPHAFTPLQKEMAQQEVLDCAGTNDVKRLRELLDSGVDVNFQDFDKGWTPLHVAAARGSKQALELLVQRGANINIQDNRGSTALHSLIYKRYDVLALWFVRQGANIHIQDQRGFSSYDMALGFFQKELSDAAAGKTEEVKAAAAKPPPVAEPKKEKDVSLPAEEVLKIYLKGNSYKSIRVGREDTPPNLITKMAAKLNMSSLEKHFEVYEVVKDVQKHLTAGENLLKLKTKWPIIIGKSGNETNLHCHFLVTVKRGSPPDVVAKYDAATL
eukprot:TRINITY_DN2698_c0_g1_i1.p1 TRINITY_DN2698_c0_g1~~TRINITY_DN2698_c0_g1_i1.p1  ORF type:complete len:275 (-),score=96.61 TRINITY_DN2698_c0_g1_i1:162-986(-)